MNELSRLLAKARDALGPGATAGDIANRLMADALDRADAHDVLMPAVFAWVHDQERARVRNGEKDLFDGPVVERSPRNTRPSPGSAAGEEPKARRGPAVKRSDPGALAMRRFLAEGCYVPGHGHVPWGKLTPALHALRVEYLERVRAGQYEGTTATIRRHQFAIGLLAESGLRDLDAYAGRYGTLPGEVTGRAKADA